MATGVHPIPLVEDIRSHRSATVITVRGAGVEMCSRDEVSGLKASVHRITYTIYKGNLHSFVFHR